MLMKFCPACKKYTLKENCAKCKGKTISKAYKFRLKWFEKKD